MYVLSLAQAIFFKKRWEGHSIDFKWRARSSASPNKHQSTMIYQSTVHLIFNPLFNGFSAERQRLFVVKLNSFKNGLV